jgi:hypothetical protein
MFTTFTNNTVLNGAARRRGDGMSSPLRLVHSNNNPSCHNPQAATVASRARERPVRLHVLACRWHVVPSTGRLECRWSEQSSDGASVEPPKPSRRCGRIGHRAAKQKPPTAPQRAGTSVGAAAYYRRVSEAASAAG